MASFRSCSEQVKMHSAGFPRRAQAPHGDCLSQRSLQGFNTIRTMTRRDRLTCVPCRRYSSGWACLVSDCGVLIAASFGGSFVGWGFGGDWDRAELKCPELSLTWVFGWLTCSRERNQLVEVRKLATLHPSKNGNHRDILHLNRFY